MIVPSDNHWTLIVFTLLGAWILTVVPLPFHLKSLAPQWVHLVLFFWVLVEPLRIGVLIAALVGLLLNISAGTAIGSISAGLALAVSPLSHRAVWVSQLDRVSQSFIVCILLILAGSVDLIMRILIGEKIDGFTYLLPFFLSAACWAPISGFLTMLIRWSR